MFVVADVQCGLPARITNGGYKLVNSTRHYLSTVSYSCAEGFQLIGRGDLICDIDGRWNGPPPRCERQLILALFYYERLISELQNLTVCG